jgi:hypothetical protein
MPLMPLPVVSTSRPNATGQVHDPNLAITARYKRDFYQYEWFRALLVLMVMFVLMIAIRYLYQLAASAPTYNYKVVLSVIGMQFMYLISMLPLLVIVSLSLQDYPLLWFRSLESGLDYSPKQQKNYLRIWVCLVFALLLGITIWTLWFT